MELNVNIVPQSYLPEIRVSKNDNTMRTIKVNLIDEKCDPWTPPAGASAAFTGTKPSGLGFTLPCTISGSAVTFTMLTTACNEVGRFPAEVRFTDGNGGRIGSCNVMMNVERDPHSDDTTDGDEEELINEITALLEEIREEHQQAVEDITEAKTDALEDIQGEHQQALQDIGAAKDDALDAIAADVQAANDAADRAEQAAEETEQAMDAWTNMSAEADTLPAGSDATASYSEGVLTLGIPKGDKGDQGAQGEPGQTGATPDMQIGTVETLDPGEDATATITGTPEEPILSLGIPQGEKGDPGDVSMEQLLALAVYDEASGEIASFPDGSDGLPMKSLKVTLEPVQDLHGYDKPWVGGAGANLFRPFNTTYRGVNFVAQTDGTVKISGTVSQNGWIVTSHDYTLSELGLSVGDSVYCYSNGNTIGEGHFVTLIRFYDSSLTLLGSINGAQTTTIPNGTTIIRMLYYGFGSSVPTQGTVVDDVGYFQFGKGSTIPTSWTPYENICPITGCDEVNTVVCGKNLLASGDLTSGGYIDNNNGTVRTYSTWSYSGFIPVSPGRYRFMRLNNGVYERITGENAYFAFYNEDKSFNVGNTGDNINFTSTNIKYLRVSAPTSYMNKIVLVADADASDFVNESDYIDGQFITTTLPQTVYGGTVDVVTGELVVDRKYAVIDDPDKWTVTTGTTNFRYTNSFSDRKTFSTSTEGFICSCFPVGNEENNVRWRGASDTTFGIVSTTMSLADVQAITESGNFAICYELAAPTTIQLTPTEVDTILGTNNVWSDGDVYVKYVADTKLYILKVLS